MFPKRCEMSGYAVSSLRQETLRRTCLSPETIVALGTMASILSKLHDDFVH